MKSDIEIAQEAELVHIKEVAEKLGINEDELEFYGKYKAKIDYNFLKKSQNKDGKLILVTAINPTPAKTNGILSHCPIFNIIPASKGSWSFFTNSMKKRDPNTHIINTPKISPCFFQASFLKYSHIQIANVTR